MADRKAARLRLAEERATRAEGKLASAGAA
jgi:hypothetical protein